MKLYSTFIFAVIVVIVFSSLLECGTFKVHCLLHRTQAPLTSGVYRVNELITCSPILSFPCDLINGHLFIVIKGVNGGVGVSSCMFEWADNAHRELQIDLQHNRFYIKMKTFL